MIYYGLFDCKNEARITELEKKVAELEKRINSLENTNTPVQVQIVEEKGLKDVSPEVRSKLLSYREAIGVNQYHSSGITGQGIKVAVLDTGVEEHPFIGRVKKINRYGRNDNYHGTHVAGIVRNIAPDAEIVDIQIFDGMKCDPNKIVLGITDAINEGVDVINISSGASIIWNQPDFMFPYNGSWVTIDAIWEDLEKRGILVVVSAGNDGTVEHFYRQLASYYTATPFDKQFHLGDTVAGTKRHNWPITTTSCSVDHKFSKFNSLNVSVKCMSFGEDIVSTWEGGKFVSLSGTSMSSPHVSGALAVLLSAYKSKYPDVSKYERAQEVRNFLLGHCTIRNIKEMYKLIPRSKELDSSLESMKRAVESNNIVQFSMALSIFTAVWGKNIIANNPQFAGFFFKPVITTREDMLSAWESVRVFVKNLEIKYTILSLGYGIVKLVPLKPRGDMKEIKKPQFELIECDPTVQLFPQLTSHSLYS
ncbi:MAG: hypothetical protein KatS3mg101_0871 [Patescibacteria group bacterium]|nr:MAG: hypothetical protein KatS3mg101_0871 [Patescibacteria group bacterium]